MQDIVMQMIDKYGIIGGIFVTLIIVAFKNPKLLAEFARNFSTSKDNNYDILKNKLTYWVNFKIKHIDIKDPARKVMFSDLLICYFEAILNNIYDGKHEKCNIKELNGEQLYNRIIVGTSDVEEQYEQAALASEIPEEVIKSFKLWHSSSVEYGLKLAETICTGSGYKDNCDKLQALYAMYTVLFEITIVDAEKALNTLNGEITGKMYKGLMCA